MTGVLNNDGSLLGLSLMILLKDMGKSLHGDLNLINYSVAQPVSSS
jgi:hypothetical protein